MNMPGFTAEDCLNFGGNYYQEQATRDTGSGGVVVAAFPRGQGFTTIPHCGPENCRTAIVYEPCGSALEGAFLPMCPAGTTTQCDYVCTYPSGIKGVM